ncbi:MAG TPA: hypothetical protein VGR05_06945 [Sphingomicrobium sp.]|nr:hypothetical protein [Sphingomicrobium sp.]
MPISIIAAALLLATGQAPAPTVAQTPAADPNKRVCKTIKETGSRLGGKRECKTQAEWDRIAAEQQAKANSNMGR